MMTQRECDELGHLIEVYGYASLAPYASLPPTSVTELQSKDNIIAYVNTLIAARDKEIERLNARQVTPKTGEGDD